MADVLKHSKYNHSNIVMKFRNETDVYTFESKKCWFNHDYYEEAKSHEHNNDEHIVMPYSRYLE